MLDSSYTTDENKPDQANFLSTLTTSECENETSKLEFIEPTIHNMLTRKRKVLKMVRHCYICKINPKDPGNEGISLHSIANNIEIRNVWFSLLGLENDGTYPKVIYICSKHFMPDDIISNKIGKRILRPNALPIPIHNAFEPVETETLSTSPSKSMVSVLSVSDLSESSPPKKIPRVELFTEFDVPSSPFKNVASPSKSTASEGGNRPSTSFQSGCTTSFQSGASSSTYTASEEANISSSTLTAPETQEVLSMTAKAEKVSTKQGAIKPKKLLIKRKRRTYVGDMDEEEFRSPRTRKKFVILKRTIFSLRKKVQTLQSKLWKSKQKISNLNDLLKYFKEKSFITESSESVLKASLSGSNKEMFERMLKGPSTQKYSPALRSFALTLAFYSPRAYNFVRSTFNRSLPHLSTITKWYKSVDGSPGFSQEALNALKIIHSEAEKQSKFVLCNLVFDEMSIRRQVEWTGKRCVAMWTLLQI
ncbi:uncharacterized protein LOC123322391 [Coccinella septempunctata]|uniref:uncharacterized protein LOC123322391 n=1 Tax=Coccinella septempunctata TaxID=41139 RepID=UPI001D0912B1|nr:uncharacterized protein LOC123322391 [Coccinella septempunctata]